MEENKDLIGSGEETGTLILDEIFNAFMRRYKPAESFKDADNHLTTSQIHSQILSHCPDAPITEKEVFNKLRENGFKEDMILGDARYVWVLKYKR